MKWIFLSAILVSIASTLHAQSRGDRVSPQTLDPLFLSQLLKEKIDSVRMRKGLHSLESHLSLEAAALHHAEYLEAKNMMSHNELNMRMRTPALRAEAFGFQSRYVGENIAQSYVDFHGNHYGPDGQSTYEEVADDLLDLWLKSPGHHENMLRSSYHTTGIALALNHRSGKIYAVQVFGGKSTTLARY